MDAKKLTKTSKFLSKVLRHQPESIGLKLDAQGWVPVEELLLKMKVARKSISLEELHLVVAENNKKRFAFSEDGLRIRASQGHSVQVDLGYLPQTPPDILYHGTAAKNLASILENGLFKAKRHHVHLSANIETALQVGGRHGKPEVLEVLAREMAAEGFEFFQSENGVWLTNEVPARFLRIKE